MEGEYRTMSYYDVLGVALGSSAEEIRRAYYKQAMRWHPDRWTRDPSLSAEAKRRFQVIQEAYSGMPDVVLGGIHIVIITVLSDERKRSMYDAGVYDPVTDEEDEGFFDFVQEMVSLMAQTRREEKQYSMEELQTMLIDMIEDFDSEPLFQNASNGTNLELDLNEAPERPAQMGLSLYPQSGFTY